MLAGVGCGVSAEEPAATEQVQVWKDLFDGKSSDGWRGYQQEKVPPSWEVRDGSIFCNGEDGAHLVTRKKYVDFELSGEWKISKGGNSGILLRGVARATDCIPPKSQRSRRPASGIPSAS
jgi:hypothetical protein